MNLLRISKDVGRTDYILDPILSKTNTHQIIFNGLEYLIGVDNITSNFVQDDNLLFIGESLSPESVKKLDLKQFANTTPEKNTYISHNFYSAILVDMKQRQVQMFSSQGGQKSLYYSMDPGNFYCASQLYLLKRLGCNFEADESVLGELFTYRTLVAPRTLVKGIRKMSPAEQIRLKLFNNDSRQMWFIDFQPIHSDETDIDEISDMTERIIAADIKNMIAKDPSVSILLSGGLDSSLLAAIANSHHNKLTSYSANFDFLFKEEQETKYAMSVADHLNIKHQVCKTNENNYLCDIVDAMSETGENHHHLQTVLLMRLFEKCALDGSRTIICGLGADDLFGNGMHNMISRFSRVVHLLTKEGMQSFVRTIARCIGIFDNRFKFFDHSFLSNTRTADHIIWSSSQYGNTKIINDVLGYSTDDILKSRMDAMDRFNHYSLMDKISLVEMEGGCGTTLPIWSQLAAKSGVTLTFPFTTTNLIRYIRGLDWTIKCRERKYIIKHLLRKYNFPEEFITRPKLGFGFPIQYWAIPGALFQPLVDMAAQKYDPRLLKSLQKMDMSKAMLLWTMINYYLWEELFIKDSSPDDIKAEIMDRHNKSNNSTKSSETNTITI